ncbi:MAG: SxtJ family membrane protein [Ignavibacteriales bacterium]|nr:SxtJ family membrane protein [Ignavibacteriales bacterium]
MKTPQERIEPFLRRWSYASEIPDVAAVPQAKTFWRSAYEYWMKFARMVGKANAVVLLTIVYFVVIGPAAIVLRIIGKDLLDRKAGNEISYWYDKQQEKLTTERSEHQF